MNLSVRDVRLALIARAVAWLDETPHAEAVRQLVSDPSIRLRNEWRTNPAELADHLRAVDTNTDSAALFGAFKAAQNVLLAAGLPHMPDDA
ncbi:hypothetical protein [Nonomuraea wenchangensis]|uniref:hypothetical protein n=1 Tax=Nonomuraea wenchangensis TaxID=568860 RepID=UPI00333487C5